MRGVTIGLISAEADPTGLATLLLAAFQGGTLLAQVARLRTPKIPTGYTVSGWFSPDSACSVSGGP
ncbi:hypothetical protein [Streptomyces sp. NPDC101149]|uniref:hypothetical protein n=1 Tax=Streptomyces sp. NPDC101149 TaxID=3366113 RepID=UPI0037FE3924